MRNQLVRGYRLRALRTRLLPGLLCAALLGGGTWACTGFADTVREEENREEGRDGQEVADQLFQAMVEVFEEETAGVEDTFAPGWMVRSRFEELEDGRRRRFFGRVVPVGRAGVGVRITGEYQEPSREEPTGWVDQPRDSILAEVEPEELRLARRVERRFHGRRR